MNFNQKIQQMTSKIFELISTKEITFLKDLDNRILIHKNGKFYYNSNICNSELDYSIIKDFLSKLEFNKIYTLIPYLSINNKTDEPYIILSKQILISKASDSFILYDYIDDKIKETINLYNIDQLENFYIIFKFKQVNIEFKEYNTFK
jgi:hypothetical protein